ncbi:MAG: adenosylcobinamide-GDP ribazoletransferase [Acidimicrobiales bacterium]
MVRPPRPNPARGALAFLTPVGGASAPAPGSLAWFPVVGAVLGLLLGGVWWAAGEVWPPAVAAALVVAADLGLTGMLHLDGLVDTADGLLPPLDRSRRLDVMADPNAGAFGIGAAVSVVMLRWSALAVMTPRPLLLAGLWCGSRTAMVIVARALPYARSSGLASAFLPVDGGRERRFDLVQPALGLAVAPALAAVALGVGGLAATGGLVVGVAAVALLARRRLGGFTGDVLGAAGMVGETVGLVVASAQW